MTRTNFNHFKKRGRIKYVISERYAGIMKPKDIFVRLFLSERHLNSNKIWTTEQNIDTMVNRSLQVDIDNSQASDCSRKE
jgi:hypothetical protein